MLNFLDHWAIWVPLIAVFSLHLLEKSQAQAGVVYPKNMKDIMRKRIQVLSFQTQEQYDTCHIKGAKRIDITELDPDALMLILEKKYPILCYCNDGIQSYRYFQHIQPLQKSFWLAGGLHACQDKIQKYCIWSEKDEN